MRRVGAQRAAARELDMAIQQLAAQRAWGQRAVLLQDLHDVTGHRLPLERALLNALVAADEVVVMAVRDRLLE